jgi:hypothetical protein
MTFTRLLSPPANVTASALQNRIIIAWDPVADAETYVLYASTNKVIDTETTDRYDNVISPYAYWGMDDVPYYFALKAVHGPDESGISAPVWAVAGWSTEAVTEADVWLIEPSIVVDSSGLAHLHYSTHPYLSDIYQSYYAVKDIPGWSISLTGDATGTTADISLDSKEGIHICRVEAAGLTHSVLASGIWTTETVATGDIDKARIAVDAYDHVHMAYHESTTTSEALMYASNNTGDWINTVIDGNVNGLGYSSHLIALAVSADGSSHIVYPDSDDPSGLRYATNRSGIWMISTVQSGVSGQLAMAVDHQGSVHILYPDTDGRLQYATNGTGSWLNEAVGSETGTYYPSIAVYNSGTVHVMYFNTAHDEVRYARKQWGAWKIIPVDDLDGIDTGHGRRTDITTGPDDSVYMIYNVQRWGMRQPTLLRFATNHW